MANILSSNDKQQEIVFENIFYSFYVLALIWKFKRNSISYKIIEKIEERLKILLFVYNIFLIEKEFSLLLFGNIHCTYVSYILKLKTESINC